MPSYIYKHPEKEEYVEVVQTMKETHEYSRDGVSWKRIYTLPKLSFCTQIDPFSQRAFVDKTGAMKGGKMGDIMDLSAEISEKRAHIAGQEDPIKRKHFDDYKKTVGKKHLQDYNKKIETKHAIIELD